jgi:hypothetical protein
MEAGKQRQIRVSQRTHRRAWQRPEGLCRHIPVPGWPQHTPDPRPCREGQALAISYIDGPGPDRGVQCGQYPGRPETIGAAEPPMATTPTWSTWSRANAPPARTAATGIRKISAHH